MSERGGTRLSSTESFKGRIFAVTVDRVAMPNGRTVTLNMVRHPGSVVLIPMQDDGRVVLIRQYRYALDRWTGNCPRAAWTPVRLPPRPPPASVRRKSASCQAASSSPAPGTRRRVSARR